MLVNPASEGNTSETSLSLIGFGSEENDFSLRVVYKQAKKFNSSVTTGTRYTNFGHSVILKSAANIARKS